MNILTKTTFRTLAIDKIRVLEINGIGIKGILAIHRIKIKEILPIVRNESKEILKK